MCLEYGKNYTILITTIITVKMRIEDLMFHYIKQCS